MSRGLIMSSADEENTDNPFQQQLIAALEHFQDPAWLEQHSPLAAPYFLSSYLQELSDEGVLDEPGQALRALLRETAPAIAERSPQGTTLVELLKLSYFRTVPVVQVCQDLNISRSTYYRYRRRAIAHLEEALIQRLKPALRLEAPPAITSDLLGRQSEIARCKEAMQSGMSIAITGSSGIGKTTLGALLAHDWRPEPVFWYTLRPALNDQLESLLFSLALFLQRMGRPGIWLQLVASRADGKVQPDYEVLLSQVRHELQIRENGRALLCFDDIDLLQPLEIERHAQILGLIQGMHGSAPMLLMGQYTPAEPDLNQTLDGFSKAETRDLLARAETEISKDALDEVQTHTGGNPRLLNLLVGLLRTGESMEEVLARITASASIEFLLNRIHQRLSEDEQQVLEALSVFRQPAPEDAWENQKALNGLIAKSLVLTNDRGMVELLPAFRNVILHRLSPETREQLHLLAASLRADRGEYTAAAYHYIKGGLPEAATLLWYQNRRREIDQGQGSAALELFEGVSSHHVSQQAREMLVLLRSELRMYSGEYDEIKKDLYSTQWQTPLLKSRVMRLEGDMAYERSKFEMAIQKYSEGLETIESIGKEMILLRKALGRAHTLKRDMSVAWREALLAQYEVENLKGSIQSDRGNYDDALRYFGNALDLAIELEFTEGEGKTRNNLAWILMQRGDYDAAQEQWEHATKCYEKVGDISWQAGIKSNQAVAHIEKGNPDKAVPLLEDAMRVYESLEHERGTAIVNLNMAEAHLLLNRLDAAERYAWRAIENDEPLVMPATYNVLAEIMLGYGKLAEAETFCQKSLELSEANQDSVNLGYGWRTLGKIYLEQGKLEDAKLLLEKAVELFQEVELPKETHDTLAIVKDVQDSL
jgi:tetratricopeptide (TPR) repeat protein